MWILSVISLRWVSSGNIFFFFFNFWFILLLLLFFLFEIRAKPAAMNAFTSINCSFIRWVVSINRWHVRGAHCDRQQNEMEWIWWTANEEQNLSCFLFFLVLFFLRFLSIVVVFHFRHFCAWKLCALPWALVVFVFSKSFFFLPMNHFARFSSSHCRM